MSNGDREMGSRDEATHNPSVDHRADAAHAVEIVCNEASAVARTDN